MSETELFEMAMQDWERIDLLDRRDPASRDSVRQAWYARWSKIFSHSPSGLSQGMNRLLVAIAHSPATETHSMHIGDPGLAKAA